MMSFRDRRIEKMAWPNTIVKLLGRIREYKGKQDLFRKQTPEILEALRKTAIIQSTESSNRIEGIIVSQKRMPLLVQEKVEPQNRSEAEVAGYRDVLALIHRSAKDMSLRPNLLLQMHRDLMNYATGVGGKWKSVDNYIREELPTGEERIRFTPVASWQTPDAMRELTAAFNEMRDKGSVDELILIGAYVLDFLCIHPFQDGNGRIARLLTILLLYQADYEVGRFISLEKVVEESMEQYYETLGKSSVGWHEGEHDLRPWLEYFLTVILKSYQKFESRVAAFVEGGKGWKERRVEAVVNRMVEDFTISQVEENCPGISRPTIQKVLNRLGHEGSIKCIERGRKARWKKLES